MAAITTRETAGTGATVAGVALTNAQIDNNFININTELGQKLPLSGGTLTGGLTFAASQWIYGKDSLGGTTRFVGINSTSDIAYFGSIDSAQITQAYIRTGGVDRLYISNSYIDTTVSLRSLGNQVLHAGNFASYADAPPTLGVPRNNLGDPTVREMALFDSEFTNKIDLYDITKVFIETSTDNVNWTTFSVTDANKRLLIGGDSGYSGLSIPYGTQYFRIRLRANGYVFLNALYSYWSSNGHSTKVKIFTKHDLDSGWTAVANSANTVSSWPGHLYLPHNTIPWHLSGAQGTHNHEVYVVFEPTWNATYSANSISLYKLQWWGGYPAGRRNIYSTDEFGGVAFPATLSAVSAITQNGNQVLHAGNYNSYSPTLTGTGASGTWGISITGSAGSIANNNIVDYLRITNTAGSQKLLMGNQDSGGVNNPSMIVAANGSILLGNGNSWAGSGGTFTSYATLNSTSANFTAALQQNSNQVLHAGNYTTYAVASNGSSWTPHPNNFRNSTWNYFYTDYGYITFGPANATWAHIYSDKNFYFNQGIWINDNRVLDAANYNTYALPISGGSITGRTTVSVGARSTAYTGSNFEIFTSDNTPPGISFHRGGYSATNLYELDGELYTQAWITRAQTGKLLSSGNYSSYALPLTGGTLTGIVTISSTNDAQLYLDGAGSSWAGIRFSDSAGNDFIWYNGSGSTFSIGGGGANVVGKKLHINGGTSIGSTLGSTGVPSNGLAIEGLTWGRGFYDSSTTRSVLPSGAVWTTSSSAPVGAFRIKLPDGTKLKYPMLSFTVHIYNYAQATSTSYRIGGHYSNNDWYNVFAYCLTDNGAARNIRFGREDSTNSICVWIGETDTAWNYPQVFVTDFQNGYSAIESIWFSDWSITLVTNYDNSVVTNGPYAPALGLNSKNYNSYSPTLTGGGASGTWSISVTGNAATSTNSTQLGGVAATNYIYGDSGSGSRTAAVTQNVYELAQYKSGFWDITGASWTPDTNWYWGATFAHISNNNAYNFSGQLIFLNGGGGDNLFARTISNGTPSGWSKLLSSGNYNSYSPTLTGGGASGTWSISVTGNAGTVTNGVYTNGSYSDPAWITSLAKSKVGLGNVENTALSTWAGSTAITTIGAATATTLAISGTTRSAGLFYSGTTAPVSTTRLNYDGNLYATNFFGTLSGDINKPGNLTFTFDNAGSFPKTLSINSGGIAGISFVGSGGGSGAYFSFWGDNHEFRTAGSNRLEITNTGQISIRDADQVEKIRWTATNNNNSFLGIYSTKASTNSNDGALVVFGGVGIGGALNVAGSSTVGGNLTVTGNLTINGTTTTVNSTTVTVDDPIFTLGGDTAPTVDDNKDRGIEFRWHNGTAAKVGFFGYDDSTGYLTFIPDATNTSEVFSGTMGDIQATNFRGTLIGNASTVTNGVYTNTAGVVIARTSVNTNSTDFNTVTTSGTYLVGGNGTWTGSTNGPTSAYQYGLLEVFTDGANVVTQRYVTHSLSETWIRSKFNASDWQTWRLLLSSLNYNSYSPTLTGTGASGTWGINVTGSAGSVAWTNVSGRPTTVSSFTNDSGYITSSYSGFMLRTTSSQSNPNTNFVSSAYRFDPNANNPTNEHYAIVTYGNESNVVGQLATHFTSGQTFTRAYNSAWSSWRTQLDSSNYSSYALPLSGGTISGNLYLSVNSQGVNGASSLRVNGDITAARGNGTSGVIYLGNSGSTYVYYDGTNYYMPSGQLDVGGNRVLTAGNYNSYSPTLTGTGASGTWGISITGNAGSSTRLINLRTINGTGFDGTADIATTEWIHSGRDFVNGTLITTSIDYSQTAGDPFILQIRGNSYGVYIPFDIQVQGYIYSDTIIHYGGTSTGPTFNIIAQNVAGKLCFWFARQSYWQGFNVHVYTAQATRAINKVVSITDVVDPNGTKRVTIIPEQVLRSGNYNNYSPTLTGGGASGTWGINVTGYSTQVNLGNSSSTQLLGSAWAGTSGYPGYQYSGSGNSRFGFSGTAGVVDVYTDGNYYANEGTNLVLHSGNYNSYSPTLTGGNASGTWGINISGNAATATTADQIDGVGFRNTGSNSGVAADTLDSNGITYVSGVSLLGQSDGALYSQAYSASWQHQIYGDYRTGQLVVRGKNSGTWQSWRTQLDSANYNSYSPTLTGGGASGTWGINVTGSAGSVAWTNVSGRPTTVSSFTNDSGYITSSGSISGNAATATNATNAWQVGTDTATKSNALQYWQLSGNSTLNPSTDWFYGIRMSHGDAETYYSATLAFNFFTDLIQYRRKAGGVDNSWITLLHSANYNSYSPTLTGTGASGSWGISVTGTAGNVTGTVAAANGGTGLTSPGSSGNVLTSNGSTWVSSAPPASVTTGKAIAMAIVFGG